MNCHILAASRKIHSNNQEAGAFFSVDAASKLGENVRMAGMRQTGLK